MGIFAVICSPGVGKLVEKVDPRLVICIGIVGLAAVNLWRATFNSDVTFLQMAGPTLLSGPFMVMFFVPVTGLAIASVDPGETANAAGLSNFMRTLAGAFATSLIQTGWNDAGRLNQTELAGQMTHAAVVVDKMVESGVSRELAISGLDGIVQGQSVMLATIDMFGVIAAVFLFAATIIWISPKPKGPIDTTAAH
jgi:DHA2 family multidrug resistance protein